MNHKLLGLLLTFIIAIISLLLNKILPNYFVSILPAAVIALILGLIIKQIIEPTAKYQAGIDFCIKNILIFAIVLLGVNLSIENIAAMGPSVLLLILILILTALFSAYFLAKFLNIPIKLACLIGIGTSICGNTAISATAPTIKASDSELACAIGINTLFGTLALILYPVIAYYLNLSDHFYGLWVGTAINDTSQVVAASIGYSQSSAQIATSTKLIRNSFLGFVVALAPLWFIRSTEPVQKPWYRQVKIPKFVFLFFMLALLNTLGVMDQLSAITSLPITEICNQSSKFFIVMALGAIGLNTSFAQLKAVGSRVLFLGFLVALMNSLLSFCLISAFKLSA